MVIISISSHRSIASLFGFRFISWVHLISFQRVYFHIFQHACAHSLGYLFLGSSLITELTNKYLCRYFSSSISLLCVDISRVSLNAFEFWLFLLMFRFVNVHTLNHFCCWSTLFNFAVVVGIFFVMWHRLLSKSFSSKCFLSTKLIWCHSSANTFNLSWFSVFVFAICAYDWIDGSVYLHAWCNTRVA